MDLMSELKEKTNITRGITLNFKHFELFKMIEEAEEILNDDSIPKEDKESAKQKIIDYLLEDKEDSKHKDNDVIYRADKYISYISKKLLLPKDEQERLKSTILNNLEAIFDEKKLIQILQKENFERPEEITEAFLESIDKINYRAKEGISDFLIEENGSINIDKTYEKVKAFYDHVLSGNYDRINFDDIASTSTYVSILRKDYYNQTKLKNALEFCQKHPEFSSKINSAFFYMASGYPNDITIKTTEDLKKYYESYFKGIAEQVQGSSLESFDIFNEFVYRDQPQVLESGEIQYGERHNGFHSILSLEEICQIVKDARKYDGLKNVEFMYNDDGFDNPQKREGIFREIKKIIAQEDYEGQLVNGIGMQFHTSINVNIEEVGRAIRECRQRFPNLNINITELDITKEIEGFDYTNATEELQAVKRLSNARQKLMMQQIKQEALAGNISELTFWSQSDEMCFKGKDKEGSMIGYDKDKNKYYGKDSELTDEEKENYEKDLEIVCKNIALNIAKKCHFNPSLQNDSQNSYLMLRAYKKMLSRCMPEVEKYIDEIIAEKQENPEKTNDLDQIIDILNEQKCEPVQDFNYHTHTMRCGHASKFSEDFEYVEEAIKAGMKEIAFTDHIPFPKGKIEPSIRMQFEEVDDYLASIEYLKREYGDFIKVKSGFEFEYIPEYLEHLQEMKSKTDIMIIRTTFC